MRNPVTWVDEKLLAATAKFVKRFNWLTGRDNFWIARFLLVPGAFLWGAFRLEMIFPSVAVTAAGFVVIKIVETENFRAASRGTKDPVLHKELGVACISLIGFCILYLPAAIVNPMPSLFTEIGVAILTFVYYLVRVDKPPFSRSMAREWLKGKAARALAALRPQPELQPVPIRIR